MTFQSTLTPEQEEAIRQRVTTHNLSRGLGDEETACSIAAINLALTGELTDRIPECMSPIIGRWIIRVQDSMPDAMRNGRAWRELLPLAAGTGRAHEKERLALVLDWMWSVVLPSLQDMADKNGFGDAWRKMCTERSEAAARAAARAAAAASAAAAEAAWAVAAAAEAAWAEAAAAEAAEAEAAWAEAAWAEAWAAEAAEAAAAEAAWAAAVAAAEAAAVAAEASGSAEAWKQFAPADILRRLIECEAAS